ncbi:unnamed protein product [Closterium sp. NIES-65]|nr:unnamed protein product [Closterium sp. NIES-65]
MADASADPLPPVPPSPPVAPVCAPLTSLDQLLHWRPSSPATCGIYNRATAPFRARSAPGAARGELPRRQRQRVLACHDMMGGYVEDARAQGSARSEVYRAWEWDSVDVWVYFSHHLVTLPPVAWSNCCRTHGVQVLGTFITEWEAGAEVCRQLLASRATAARAAHQLALVAHYHGFHGWLVLPGCWGGRGIGAPVVDGMASGAPCCCLSSGPRSHVAMLHPALLTLGRVLSHKLCACHLLRVHSIISTHTISYHALPCSLLIITSHHTSSIPATPLHPTQPHGTWQVNIENTVEKERVPTMLHFLRTLTHHMHALSPHALVLWSAARPSRPAHQATLFPAASDCLLSALPFVSLGSAGFTPSLFIPPPQPPLLIALCLIAEMHDLFFFPLSHLSLTFSPPSLPPPPCLPLVSPLSPPCLPLVSPLYPPCIPLVSPLYPPCLPLVSPLPPPCLPLVSPLSPPCIPLVSPLSPPCLPLVSPLSPPCLPLVSPLSPPCLPLVSPLSPPCLPPVSPLYPPCLPPVSPLSPPCLPLASPLSPPCLPLVSPLYPPCLPLVSPLSPPCLPLASPLPPPCLPLVSPLSPPCLPLVSPLYPPCLPPVSPLYRPCLPLVSPLSPPCIPLVSPLSPPCLPLVSPLSPPCLPLVSPLSPPCLPLASPLSPPCLPLVSPLPPPCLPLVSPLSPPCLPLASPLPPPCLPLVSPLSPPCLPLVSPLYPPCIPLVSPLSPPCLPLVSPLYPPCIPLVSPLSPPCLPLVSPLSPPCLPLVSPLSPPCLPLVSPLYPPCIPLVSPLSPPCLPLVSPLSPPCLPLVSPLYPPCIPLVSPLSPPCLPLVSPLSPPCLPLVSPLSPPCLPLVSPLSPPCLPPVSPLYPPCLPLSPPCLPLVSPLSPPCLPLVSPLSPPCLPLVSPLYPPCIPLVSPLSPPCLPLVSPLSPPCLPLVSPLYPPCLPLVSPLYDSVTEEGELRWQDALTPANRCFFLACDGIFTNYSWKDPAKVLSSVALAGSRAPDVFMGVDCFLAPGRAARGFDAGQAVGVALQGGASAAVFAPAWVYETRQEASFDAAQERLWHSIRTALHSHRSLRPHQPLQTQQGGQGDGAGGMQGTEGVQEGDSEAGGGMNGAGESGERGAVAGTVVCAGGVAGERSVECGGECESGFPLTLPLFTAFDQGVGTNIWLAGRHVASSHWSNFSCQTLRPVHMHTSRPLLSTEPAHPSRSVRCSLWHGTAWEGSAALLLSLSPSPPPRVVPDSLADQAPPDVQPGPTTSACVVDVFRPHVHVQPGTTLHVSYSVVSAPAFIACLALSFTRVPTHPPNHHHPTDPTPPALTAPDSPPPSTILLLPPPPHPPSLPHPFAPPSLSSLSASPSASLISCLFPTAVRPSPSHLTPPTTTASETPHPLCASHSGERKREEVEKGGIQGRAGESAEERGAGREQGRLGGAVWAVREYEVPCIANHVLTGVHVLLVGVGDVGDVPAGDAAAGRGGDREHAPCDTVEKEVMSGGHMGAADWLVDVCRAAWIVGSSLASAPVVGDGGGGVGGDGGGDGGGGGEGVCDSDDAAATDTGEPTAAAPAATAACEPAGSAAPTPEGKEDREDREDTDALVSAVKAPAHAALPCPPPAVLPAAAAAAVGHVRVAAEPEAACVARWKVGDVRAEQMWWIWGEVRQHDGVERTGGEEKAGRKEGAGREEEAGSGGAEGKAEVGLQGEVEEDGECGEGNEAEGNEGGSKGALLSMVLHWTPDGGAMDCESAGDAMLQQQQQQQQQEGTWKLCSDHGPVSCRYDVLAAFDWLGASKSTGGGGQQVEQEKLPVSDSASTTAVASAPTTAAATAHTAGPAPSTSAVASAGARLADSPLAARLASLHWQWLGAAHVPSFVVDSLPLPPAAVTADGGEGPGEGEDGAAAKDEGSGVLVPVVPVVLVVVRPRCLLCGAAPAVEVCPWLLLHRP